MSVQQVAKYLGISKETVYRRIEDRSIPKHRLGKLWKFNKEEIDSWVISGKAGK
jgi:excisionase family DNA binding protein